MNPCVVACTRKLSPAHKQQALDAGIHMLDRNLLSYTYADAPETAVTLGTISATAVFTSVHAIMAVQQLISKFALQLKNKTCFCIQGHTATKALEAGFEVLDTAPDSHSLLEKILLFKPISLVHYSSNIRLDEWKETLASHQIPVQTVEVYHKIKQPYAFGPINGVAFFSPSQVAAFCELNTLTSGTPTFCIGATTAGAVQKLNHQPILIADKHSEEAVMEIILHYYQTRKHES
ncbi:MAG: uroporphyrinogen-III synthase [Bacteroidia bacterium]|jgi:uroporphyrinogen-III synthase